MLRVNVRIALLSCFLLSVPLPSSANVITIDFESLSDLDALGGQFAGITFSNGAVLAAGSSLNEFEFPPRSGVNVAYDSDGPMSIYFLSGVYSVSGYFTYTTPLTLTAFDATNNEIGSVNSLFSANFASSGTLGANPNELLQYISLSAISHITITGDALGGSFVLDDLTYDTSPSEVPITVPDQSSTILLLAMALVALLVTRSVVSSTGS